MQSNKTEHEEFLQDRDQNRIYQCVSLAEDATELIAGLMHDQKVTKSELAKSIGKSKAFVTQLLSGSRNMTLHTFAELAFALGHRVQLSSLSLVPVEANRIVSQQHECDLRDRWNNHIEVTAWPLNTTRQLGVYNLEVRNPLEEMDPTAFSRYSPATHQHCPCA